MSKIESSLENLGINDYQRYAKKLCVGNSYTYTYLGEGIVEELGELKGKIAKLVRNGTLKPNFSQEEFFNLPEEIKTQIRKEMGDLIWFVAVLCDWFGWELKDPMVENLIKLWDREMRNKLIGEGDNR